jgi:RNA polymerase sigma factor (TIGR02999 family)
MESDDCTRLLEEVNAGDVRAFESLVSDVYAELRQMARSLMRGQIDGHTLQPTALVNEAYLRLAQGETRWDSKAHFFGAAAQAMRQVLIDEARRRSAQKRAGNAVRVTFSELSVQAEEPQLDLLALDEAMTALAHLDDRFTRVLELRYFGGLSLEETAQVTGYSLATVKRDWAFARAWLYERMNS